MNRLLNFNLLLGFSALFIAGCAAIFSIWGIGLLFSGASIAAMIMASSLELGKLVATSFLYRFWTKSRLILKMYLCVAVFILMIITSMGIFGYLSSAYQQSSIKYNLMMENVSMLESQKKQEQLKINDVKLRIESLLSLRKTQESRLSEINNNALLARNPIQFRQVQDQTIELIDQTDKNIKNENDKSITYSTNIENIDKKISEIKLNSTANKDIQTFKFVADEFKMDLNTVVKWFIVVLIFVFDPLAVALVLAYNMAISREYEIYKSIDKNSTNKNVTDDNVLVSKTEPTDSLIEKYDTNKDGIIDSKESDNISSEDKIKMENKGDEFFKRYFSHR